MSAFLDGYLNYIVSLSDATDEDLHNLVSERDKFTRIGEVEYESAVDSVFGAILDDARQLEKEQIEKECVKLAEDATAVAAIWTFGLSMAAFAELAETELALNAAIKMKENNLYTKLSNADMDMASKIGQNMHDYIDLYTGKNKTFFQTQGARGTTVQDARAYVYSFFDYVATNGGLGLVNIRKYIGVARLTLDDPHLIDIRDALDQLQLSDKSPEDIKTAINKIQDSKLNVLYLGFARAFTLAIFKNKMNLSHNEIQTAIKASDITPEEVDSNVLENMDAIGKVMAGMTIALSIVDSFLNIYNIVEIVDRYKKQVSVLTDAQNMYKDYYKHLTDASKQYITSQRRAFLSTVR